MATRSEREVLARAIKQAQWQHHRALDSRLQSVGASIVQWDVLRALDADPAASAHDLAVATFQSDQALGTLAKRMEAKGLISRSAPRGRRFEHRITEHGRIVLEAGHRFAEEVFDESFVDLSVSERKQLLGLLERVREPGPA